MVPQTPGTVASVLAWGQNVYGKTNVPAGLTQVVALAAGFDHSLALRLDGSVVGWGRNSEGQITVPASMTNVIGIAAGGYHSVALKADGTVGAWGYNQDGQCTVPAGLGNVAGVAAGGFHTIALRSNSTVRAWGSNLYGQTNVPPDLSNVVAVAAGGHHSLALKADGTVVAWGRNDSGQTNVPPDVADVAAIVAGHQHSVSLLSNGTVRAWGLNDRGQTSVPDGLSNVVAIAGVGYHVLAIKTGGGMVAWGDNLDGQCTIHPALTNVAVAAGGWGHTLVVVGPQPPCLMLQPESRTVYAGTSIVFRAVAAGSLPLSYQWQRDETNLPGATETKLTLSNAQQSDSGIFQIVVTNPYGSVTSAPATLIVRMPLDYALNTTNLSWSTSTGAPWLGQRNVTHDATAAAQSGSIGHNQQTVLQTTVTGPGTLSFWWKVSSEAGNDTLKLQVGASVLATISGEVDWRPETFYLTAGTKQPRWIYSKNASVTSGEDAGWLDQVSYVPGGTPPMILSQPTSVSVLAGASATFSVTAGGTPPFSYQWQKEETNIASATNSLLVLTNLHRHDSGILAVVVTNAYGSALSSNATLTVRAPQRLLLLPPRPGGSFDLLFGDADGSPLLPGDVANFEVRASTNLVDWLSLPYELTLTNGSLLLQDPESTNVPVRFYRVIER